MSTQPVNESLSYPIPAFYDECNRFLIWREGNYRRVVSVPSKFVSYDFDNDGNALITEDRRNYYQQESDEREFDLRFKREHKKADNVSAWSYRRASDVKMQTVDWAWPGFLAFGEIATWSGEVGQGKTLTALDLAARLSTGAAWPDGTPNDCEPCATLYISEEESFEHTVIPRWLAAGGDPEMLCDMQWNGADPLYFDKDLGKLEAIIEDMEDRGTPVRCIIFDPLADYTSKDALKDQDVRQVVARLKQWAAEKGIAIFAIAHVNKKNDLSAVQRTSGAKGWVSVPRINNLVGTDANGLKHLATQKTNIHKPVSCAFQMQDAEVSQDGETFKTVKVAWQQGSALVTADDLVGVKKMAELKEKREEETSGYYITRWIQQNVTPEGVPGDVVKKQLREMYGLSEDKARREAKDAGVVFERTKTTPSTVLWKYTPPAINSDIPF